ncbi:hypothetical protein GUJ93_ZPchr0013g36455 [Zizania palustris]|uniref:Uncharacterized protein n=1 Tax=Zizania palustris TaxID=103762 RepID=A0A8J5X5T1_ZIZPA|nr:hypothetical protein GUJ93_ZPchr0013g36455 [Zizania palustris]
MVLSATPTNAFLLIGDGFAIGVDVDSTCPLLFPYRQGKEHKSNLRTVDTNTVESRRFPGVPAPVRSWPNPPEHRQGKEHKSNLRTVDTNTVESRQFPGVPAPARSWPNPPDR